MTSEVNPQRAQELWLDCIPHQPFGGRQPTVGELRKVLAGFLGGGGSSSTSKSVGRSSERTGKEKAAIKPIQGVAVEEKRKIGVPKVLDVICVRRRTGHPTDSSRTSISLIDNIASVSADGSCLPPSSFTQHSRCILRFKSSEDAEDALTALGRCFWPRALDDEDVAEQFLQAGVGRGGGPPDPGPAEVLSRPNPLSQGSDEESEKNDSRMGKQHKDRDVHLVSSASATTTGKSDSNATTGRSSWPVVVSRRTEESRSTEERNSARMCSAPTTSSRGAEPQLLSGTSSSTSSSSFPTTLPTTSDPHYTQEFPTFHSLLTANLLPLDRQNLTAALNTSLELDLRTAPALPPHVRTVRHAAAPLPDKLCAGILDALRAIPWSRTRRHRPGVVADNYCVVWRHRPREEFRALYPLLEKVTRFRRWPFSSQQGSGSKDVELGQHFSKEPRKEEHSQQVGMDQHFSKEQKEQHCFKWTHCAVTKNFVSSPHIDDLDQAPQLVCSFGDFGDGEDDAGEHDDAVPDPSSSWNSTLSSCLLSSSSRSGDGGGNKQTCGEEQHGRRNYVGGAGDLCILEVPSHQVDLRADEEESGKHRAEGAQIASCAAEDEGGGAGAVAGSSKKLTQTRTPILHRIRTHNAVAAVDGRFLHFVAPYVGERFSLVFYNLNESDFQPRTEAVFRPLPFPLEAFVEARGGA